MLLRQFRGRALEFGAEQHGAVGQLFQRFGAVLQQSHDARQVDFFRVAAAGRHARRHAFGQFGVVHLLDVVGVDPVQLLRIPLRRRLGQVLGVEPRHELLAAEEFVVAMAPAQAGQVVDHRLGQVALVVVLHHVDGAMALGQLFAVGAQDHRHVAVFGQGGAERAQDVDLARRVVDVVVAAQDVGDAHVPVVDHDAEVVGGGAVRARDDQIVEFAVVEADRALDHVVPGGGAFLRVLEAHDGLAALGDGGQRLAGFGAPGSVVARLVAAGARGFAHGFHFLGRAVAVVGGAGGQHLRDHFAVAVHALHLVEGAFVGLHAQPVHAVQDGLHGLRRRALDVRVLDAQDEGALVVAREGPGEQRRAGAAQVQETRGRRRETGTNGGRGVGGHRWQ